ncbi:LPS export ABC transporter periplasmic protein LptC [Flexithrix dorotheae]|uniref:LPS export ABC transporter periplasmic protein LptC n=1 Tax=Flexithrix dorotheae TaxID=70993 RepID=UPI00036ECEFC|nr:LPS export ABC transporter periplasmic protein LptC [Flexithrix dorotheae]
MNKVGGYFIIISVLSFLGLFASCSEKAVEEEITEKKEGENIPIMEFTEVSASFSQSSTVRVKVKAPLQHQYQNNDESYPEGVFLEFFDSLGRKTTTLEADSGFHEASDDSYRVRGNVVVINLEENQKLETEILHWSQVKKEIYTDTLTPVKITTKEEIIEGNGMTAKQDFSEFEITGGVTGIFTIKDEL